jgi:type IV secretory pathway TraG/TraD family ATPase VirD4
MSSSAIDAKSRAVVEWSDELKVLRDNQQLVLVENLNPVAADKGDWFKDQSLGALGLDLISATNPQASPKLMGIRPCDEGG